MTHSTSLQLVNCPSLFEAPSGNVLNYITSQYSDGKLRVFTLPEFENYELQETADRLTLILNFVCTGETRSLTFIQRIKAVNNFDPEFSSSSYVIVIPTPLPPRLDITMFMPVSSSNHLNYRTSLDIFCSGFHNKRNRSRFTILPTHVFINRNWSVQSGKCRKYDIRRQRLHSKTDNHTTNFKG